MSSYLLTTTRIVFVYTQNILDQLVIKLTIETKRNFINSLSRKDPDKTGKIHNITKPMTVISADLTIFQPPILKSLTGISADHAIDESALIMGLEI